MAKASNETTATAEERRLQEARAGVPWWARGPDLSERLWGTVREDYSDSADAWSYFTYDPERSRAHTLGEDGLADISHEKQTLCLALALWNERDPILKERLSGLTNAEGNHDLVLFHEYSDGDDGAGLGAPHQTGWTGLVPKLIQSLGQSTPAEVVADKGWPLGHPYRGLQIRPLADHVSTAPSRVA